MKLSDKQKEVIQYMRDGWELVKTRFIGYSSVTLSKDNAMSKFVHKNGFEGLILKKLIKYFDKNEKGRMTSYLELTELGKTIEL